MLPIISIENAQNLVNKIISDIPNWRKEMIHYIKDENPELNSAIVEMAQKTELDAKALATGAYMAYKLLENEARNDEASMSSFDDEE